MEAGGLDGVDGDVVRVEGNARVAADNRIEVAATAVRGADLSAAPGAAAPEVRIKGDGRLPRASPLDRQRQ